MIDEELERMIGYVGKLSEVDTTGVEPMVHPVMNEGNVLREDIVMNTDARESMMKNAPQVKDDMFVVPRSI